MHQITADHMAQLLAANQKKHRADSRANTRRAGNPNTHAGFPLTAYAQGGVRKTSTRQETHPGGCLRVFKLFTHKKQT